VRALLARLCGNALRHQGGLVRGLTCGLRKRKERLVYWKVLSGKHSSGTGDEASGAEAYLYVISCGLERAKIGVAGYASRIDPRLSSMSSFRQSATATHLDANAQGDLCENGRVHAGVARA